MKGAPLTQDLAPGTWIQNLIGRDAGEVIAGDVAHTIAAGLDGVHLHLSQCRQNVGRIL